MLTWDDPDAIADALDKAGFSYDRLTMTLSDLRVAIVGLEGFADRLDPPDETVLEEVMLALTVEDGVDDDGRHDGWA